MSQASTKILAAVLISLVGGGFLFWFGNKQGQFYRLRVPAEVHIAAPAVSNQTLLDSLVVTSVAIRNLHFRYLLAGVLEELNDKSLRLAYDSGQSFTASLAPDVSYLDAAGNPAAKGAFRPGQPVYLVFDIGGDKAEAVSLQLRKVQ
jgi:hypothetical protein